MFKQQHILKGAVRTLPESTNTEFFNESDHTQIGETAQSSVRTGARRENYPTS